MNKTFFSRSASAERLEAPFELLSETDTNKV
jgi:hypothetical protein